MPGRWAYRVQAIVRPIRLLLLYEYKFYYKEYVKTAVVSGSSCKYSQYQLEYSTIRPWQADYEYEYELIVARTSSGVDRVIRVLQ